MTLKEKLQKLKRYHEETAPEELEIYKDMWQIALSDLFDKISKHWLKEYTDENLMTVNLIPLNILNPLIGEYDCNILEIRLANNSYIRIEPIAAITTEYDGKIRLKLMGDYKRHIDIHRRINSPNSYDWITLTPQHNTPKIFDKKELEGIIEKWLE